MGGVTLKAEFAGHGVDYLLALLNSRLMRWYFPQISAPFRGGWRSANRQFLSRLPIRLIDFKNASDVALWRELIAQVASMRYVRAQLAKQPAAEVLQRQVDAVDTQIDRLVYQLYGLTDDEIALVEG